jgi:uncharacterized protein involved in response to NO
MAPSAGSTPDRARREPRAPRARIGGIPRYRPTALPALFSQGFRPFFLAAALWAPVSLGLFLLQLAGWIDLPTAFDPPTWHAHEMLFGFAMAAMAGHLMTAIPNWTGRMPLQGAALLVLASVWLLGRVAVATSTPIGAAPAAVADLSFPALLTVVIGREIFAGRNWRNLPMIAALMLLFAANAVTHAAAAGWIESGQAGIRGGIAVFALLIALVGGRIIPSFTRNRLARLGATTRPAASGFVDRSAIALVATGGAAWAADVPGPIAGLLLLMAGLATAARLARWHGALAIGEPPLLALHLGYGWLALGLALLGAAELWPTLPSIAGLHALTTGAVGTTIMAVMARTALSRAGRRTNGGQGTLAFGLITLAACLRVAAPFLSAFNLQLVALAGLAWISGFAVLIALCAGALLTRQEPRHDDRPRSNAR